MISALASGVCDKTVSLVYESRIHQRATETWIDRCLRQVSGGLDQIDALVGANPHSWLVSDRIGAADIAVATMWRFVVQTQSGRLDPARWPMIARHSETCESRPEFRRIYQPYTFTPPQTSQSS
jgi:glutathione S-transferase